MSSEAESQDESARKDRLVPPDLSGQDPKEILRGFMKVDPKKVEERIKDKRGEADG